MAMLWLKSKQPNGNDKEIAEYIKYNYIYFDRLFFHLDY